MMNRSQSLLLKILVSSLMISYCCNPAVLALPIDPADLLGTLSVTSNPSGASVTIDGSYAGTTPYTQTLAIGTHTVLITKTGYSDYSQQVQINSRSTTNVNAPLVPQGGGCWGSAPSADFTATPTGGAAPLKVRFTAVMQEGVLYGWDFDHDQIFERSGYGPSFASIEWTYQNPGTYSVFLKTEKGTAPCIFENELVRTGYITVTDPVAATGSISIQSVPSGSSITLDGVTLSGRPTPYTATGLTPGNHVVQLTLSGYEDYVKTVSVASGQTATMTAVLTQNNQPPGTTGSAAITSTPSGAMISIDTVAKGMTPMTIPGLLPGTHAVKLTLNGYEEYNAVITTVAGQETTLNIPLVKTGTSDSTTGTIAVTSNPAGASINLDGWEKGKTPQTLSGVKTGEHTLSLKLAGYNDWSAKVVVGGGQNTPVSVTLTPLSTDDGNHPSGSGSITVASNPAGANVYLDGDLKGTTPLVIQDLSPGNHKILLTMKGYIDSQEIVEVKAGSSEKVSVTLNGGNRLPGFTLILAVVSLCLVVMIRKYYR